MKFSCEKALLSTAVAVTSRAVAAKSSIPAMEGILIEAGAQLRLTGYNLETGIRTIVVDDPVSCQAYGAGKMLHALNDMTDGMVNFARKRQLRA